jgi:AcrR family transcriptional regulator
VANEGKEAAAHRPRADAERNRQRLLETAKVILSKKGASASMDEIARTAGVGAGTLYRHFPTRDALVAAVYCNETEQLVSAGVSLAAKHPPTTALRKWLLLFVDYVATKHGMYPALDAMIGGTSDLYSTSVGQVRQAFSKLLERAVSSGDIQLNIDPMALLRAIAGVASVNSGRAGEQDARRMVDLLLDGMRRS